MRRLLRRWLGTLSAEEIETLVHAALVDSEIDDYAMRAIADQCISRAFELQAATRWGKD